MKKQLQLDDAFDGETAELSDELYEALGELRPDPKGFREGVQDRIDAAEANASAVPSAKLNAFARRAAAFFPPVLLGKGAAKLGVGAPVAAKMGTKFLPGLLVFPVVSIIMVFFTLLIGLKTIFTRADGQQRQDRDEANIDTKLWWGRFWLPFALMTVLSFILMFKVPGDAFALLITISTLSFLGVYASLVRAGLATRREVGMRASIAMIWLMGLSLQMASPLQRLDDSIAYGWLVPLFLIIGSTCCAILGKPEAKSNQKGYRWRTPLLLLGGSILVAMVLGLSLAGGKKEATYDDVRAWVASYEAGEDDEDRCYEVPRVERVITNFYAAGEPRFDLKVLRRAAREGLEVAFKTGSFNTLCAASFARLGFLEDADYENFIDEDEVETMLSSRRMISGDHDLPALLAHLHFGSLSYQERHLIADKAIATLDPTRRLANAKDVLWIIHYLDALDLSERVQELEQPAHEILKRLWCRVVSGKEACFTAYPTSAKRDEDGAITETSASSVWGDATSRAVYLMKRLGVPEFLSASDLAALDAYLLGESHQFEGSEITRYHAEAVSARTLLHTMPGWESSRAEEGAIDEFTVKRILEFRVVIAAALLVIFSLLLTLRAPSSTSRDGDPDLLPNVIPGV
jgi:hypothetical protein